jgi:uncharacterized protein (TIGR02270 family)
MINLGASIAANGQRGRVIPVVLQQHVEDAATLHSTRTTLTRAAQITLRDLRRFDERIAAHLDALTIAGERAWEFCDAALEVPSSGNVFAAAVHAIHETERRRIDSLVALTEAVPESLRGLMSAFGWVESDRLQGLVASLLDSQEAPKRTIGIGACALHRVDPGLVSARRVDDIHPRVRARAFRTAGELGQRGLLSAVMTGIADDDQSCRFWAAWSAVLLGDRGRGLEFLAADATQHHGAMQRAVQLSLAAMAPADALLTLRILAQRPESLRTVIEGIGYAGEPTYVPWLISNMADDEVARAAGESFSLIAGLDFSEAHVDRPRPEDFEVGPNDDPMDPNVDMDPDEGLPWPDQQKIDKWWAANSSRFTPGQRYFMGAPVTREHCIEVLKNGYQRQRILAAHYLCLLEPGTPLFNTSAPAWRQQRLLAEMK